jgi:hypothetical protein
MLAGPLSAEITVLAAVMSTYVTPHVLSLALAAYGLAFRDADPVGALNAVGRGLVIAQDSGNRTHASILAVFLARLEAEHGDTVSPFDHLTLAIRNFHNSGDTTSIRSALAVLAALFDRLGRYEPAATIAGFAFSPFTAAGVPEITTAVTHLRSVFGDQTYESLAHKGETMTTAAMVTYAYDQIDQARIELNAVSLQTSYDTGGPTTRRGLTAAACDESLHRTTMSWEPTKGGSDGTARQSEGSTVEECRQGGHGDR